MLKIGAVQGCKAEWPGFKKRKKEKKDSFNLFIEHDSDGSGV